MLLQNQHFLPHFGQQDRDSKPTDPTADDDSIQILRYFTGQETWNNTQDTRLSLNLTFH